MSEKHYNAEYLNTTAKILEDVKRSSYDHFAYVPEGGIVADIGCGVGKDVMNMSHVFGGRFRVVGVDHDNTMIEAARRSAEPDRNIRFFVSDVSALPFETDSLNGVRAERLVQHLADPPLVFKEISRVLKPGGKVVIVETDWDSLSFYNGNTAVAGKINTYLTEEKVRNGLAGKEITNYFSEYGFQQIRFDLYPFILTNYKDACDYLWIDRIVDEMTAQNILDQTERNAFIDAQKAADTDGFFVCCINIVIGSANKYS